jgi:hypothetical protein
VVTCRGILSKYVFASNSTPTPPPTAVPIPLTMLVLHDSCLHDWWEVHNYNAHHFGLTDDRLHELGY